MSEQTFELETIRIKTPCTVAWESMRGDDRSRFCDHCRLNVYNIESMTRNEALALIQTKESRPCIRLHLRRDGKVMTRDCGLALRSRARRMTAIAAGCALVLIARALTLSMPASSDKNSVSPPDLDAREVSRDVGRKLISQKISTICVRRPFYRYQAVRTSVDWLENELYPRLVFFGLYE